MRLITGGIMHETHTFSSEPTTLETLETILRGDELLAYAGVNHSLGGVIDACRDQGIDLAPTFFADGASTGTPDGETFAALVGELCDRVAAALPADGIVLALHGAMVAEGFDDAEAEIVRRVREVVGADMPMAVTLDLHANIGQAMVDHVDVITTYDTYPHTDAADRAKEAVALLAQTIRGEIRPVMALAKPPLLPVPQAMATGGGPFKTLFDRAHEIERSGEALTVTVAGGFPYADVPEAGVGFLVTTDGDPAAARRLADDLAALAWSLRHEMIVRNTPPAQAVAEAIAFPEGPVMLVDVGDNIGGGTPGDGTILLAELLAQGVQEATVVIADAGAAQAAFAAGVGAVARLFVGGKTDRLHGDPVEVEGRVRLLCDGQWVHEGPENAGGPVDMGPTALLRCDGVNLVLTSRKSLPGDQQQLKSVGIDPLRQKIIVVKAAVRWRGGFEPIAKHAVYADTPGLGSVDLRRFPYQNLRRPVFPLDPDKEFSPGNDVKHSIVWSGHVDPKSLADEIAQRIWTLPDQSTASIRVVRREYSQRLRDDSAAEVLAIAEALLDRQRWVAYELLYHHPSRLAGLDVEQVERLGRGINGWASVDAFARYIAGPAWQQGLIPDEAIHRWAASPDRFWRRAALVATVALNLRAAGGRGDTVRTLDICDRLVADHDDTIVKALSWALRELAIWDPDAVRAFLATHEDALAARVKREVCNKLETGLNNPAREAR